MAHRKIQLINSPLSPSLVPSIRAGAYPPLHLISLASYIRAQFSSCEVEILDGELLPLGEILARLDENADLVGISANTLTYDTAVAIGDAARELGIRTVLGGAHAYFMAKEILSNRAAFDVVVVGDGEEAICRILRGDALELIPNVAFCCNSTVVRTQEMNVPFEKLPPAEYSILDVDAYHARYRQLYPEKPFQRALSIFSAKGCRWRDKTGGGCVFCSIQHPGFRIKTPSHVWDEIRQLHETYDADLVWDVSDTFTMQKDWVAEFAQTCPRDLEIGFHLYGRASDITPQMAEWLRAIGTYEVFLGLEAGSDEILRLTIKGCTSRQNFLAVRLLNDYGIKVVASFILGLPGETKETLQKTMDAACTLSESADISEMHCSVLLPLPGSGAFRRMVAHPQLGARYKGEDLLDLERLRADWVTTFCDVTYEHVLATHEQLLHVVPRVGSFGRAAMPANTSSAALDGAD